MVVDHNQLGFKKKKEHHFICQHILLHPSSSLLCGDLSFFVLQRAAQNLVYLRLLCYVTDMVSQMRECRPPVVSIVHYTNHSFACLF